MAAGVGNAARGAGNQAATAARGSWGKLLEAGSIGSVAIPFLFKDKNTKAMEDIVSRQERLAEKDTSIGGRAYEFLNKVERPGSIVDR